jgi:hypothetical protein
MTNVSEVGGFAKDSTKCVLKNKQTNILTDFYFLKLLNLQAHVGVRIKDENIFEENEKKKSFLRTFFEWQTRVCSVLHLQDGITCQGNMRNWSKLILLHISKESGKKKE